MKTSNYKIILKPEYMFMAGVLYDLHSGNGIYRAKSLLHC